MSSDLQDWMRLAGYVQSADGSWAKPARTPSGGHCAVLQEQQDSGRRRDATAGRSRAGLLITKPEFQKRMQEITESFVLQLVSAFPTGDGATLTGRSLRSAIASSMPADGLLDENPGNPT